MLKPYLSSLPADAARRAFAESCGTSLGHLRNCIYGNKPISPETCVLIEVHSAQAVRRWHLRPTDWHRIWPELIGAPDAPIVPTEHRLVFEGGAHARDASLQLCHGGAPALGG